MAAPTFGMSPSAHIGPAPPPTLDVVIEVPRGSFLKRGSSGHIDFVSPLPCPFNYGAVPGLLGLEGDLLDALVLGPRLRYGTRVHVTAWAAVTLTDRGMSDDKLICCTLRAEPRRGRQGAALLPLLCALQGVAESVASAAGAKRLRWLVHGGAGTRPRPALDGAVDPSACPVLTGSDSGHGPDPVACTAASTSAREAGTGR